MIKALAITLLHMTFTEYSPPRVEWISTPEAAQAPEAPLPPSIYGDDRSGLRAVRNATCPDWSFLVPNNGNSFGDQGSQQQAPSCIFFDPVLPSTSYPYLARLRSLIERSAQEVIS